MKVTNYTQNNMPKQQFGMQIKFHPDDVAKGSIPYHETMIKVLSGTNKLIANLKPDDVRLQYQGGVPRGCRYLLFGKMTDCWHLRCGDFEPIEFLVGARGNVAKMIRNLVRTANSFAQSIASQETRRAHDAVRVQTVAQEIKDAELV